MLFFFIYIVPVILDIISRLGLLQLQNHNHFGDKHHSIIDGKRNKNNIIIRLAS